MFVDFVQVYGLNFGRRVDDEVGEERDEEGEGEDEDDDNDDDDDEEEEEEEEDEYLEGDCREDEDNE